jgi:hypothetical protein
MQRVFLAVLVGLCCATLAVTVQGQSKKKPAPAKPALRSEAIAIECPNPLGDGVKSGQRYCDIVTANDVKNSAVIRLPTHRGVAVVTFDLHNRQMYSAELERSGRAYTRALATIVAAGLDGTVLQRNAVLSEFRKESDLLERIGGGAGPGGVKAVAPVGTERVAIDVPQDYDAITLVGESLSIMRLEGNETVRAPGRPIAVVSNAQIQYQPAPPAKKAPPSKKKTVRRTR